MKSSGLCNVWVANVRGLSIFLAFFAPKTKFLWEQHFPWLLVFFSIFQKFCVLNFHSSSLVPPSTHPTKTTVRLSKTKDLCPSYHDQHTPNNSKPFHLKTNTASLFHFTTLLQPLTREKYKKVLIQKHISWHFSEKSMFEQFWPDKLALRKAIFCCQKE